MAQARTEPPSDQRSCEARAAGHAPRTVLVAAAVSFSCLTVLLSWLSPSLTPQLGLLMTEPLGALARGEQIDAVTHLSRALNTFVPYLTLLLLASGAACAVALALVQGFRFRLVNVKPRHPFAESTSTRALMSGLTALATLVVIALSVHDALWTAHEDVTGVLWRAGLRLSVALLLVAACDAALARASFWRSLWMTRQQRRDEEREAHGSPEMRAERERFRRELGRSRS